MQIISKIGMQVWLFLFVVSSFSAGHLEARVKDFNKRIYHKSLSGLNSIIDVRDEIQDAMEDLEFDKRDLEDKSRDLKVAASDLDSIFPKGKGDLSLRARGLVKRLKVLEREEERKRRERMLIERDIQKNISKKSTKSGKAAAIGIIVGAVVSIALGAFLIKSFGRSSRNNDGGRRDKDFIRGLGDFLECVK